ncbi:MAG: protein rep [Bacteroidetes bacterium]|nr:protein rep [Bacteroidota bacterium]
MGQEKERPLQRKIYTLAQSETGQFLFPAQSNEKIVLGNGSDLSNYKRWVDRAKRKITSQAMNLGLIEAAENKGDLERLQEYWNTFHCLERLTNHEGRSYGKYCKNRSCTLCSSIRKAEIINRYSPVLQCWEAPFFITLTVRSVNASDLNKLIGDCNKTLQKIIKRLKKRHERGKGVKPVGIRSLECNFNPAKGTYNPHFHLIVENEEIADAIIKEWLKDWTPKHALPYCQDKQRVRNIESCLIEVIKYSSKIFSEPDASGKDRLPNQIYAAALDNIFQALKPHRIFDRFGFNAPKVEKEVKLQLVPASECEEYIYAVEVYDWINEKTGERLTGYTPTAQIHAILLENIDTNIQ